MSRYYNNCLQAADPAAEQPITCGGAVGGSGGTGVAVAIAVSVGLALKELNDIIPVENKRIKIRAKIKITDNSETATINPVFDLPCLGSCSL